MKSIVIAVAAGLTLAFAGVASAEDADALLKANGCSGCHDMNTKKVGPAMKDVAAKAPAKGEKRDAYEADLVKKVTSGKGHPGVKAKPEDVQKTIHAVVDK